jgi:hypothetical protein
MCRMLRARGLEPCVVFVVHHEVGIGTSFSHTLVLLAQIGGRVSHNTTVGEEAMIVLALVVALLSVSAFAADLVSDPPGSGKKNGPKPVGASPRPWMGTSSHVKRCQGYACSARMPTPALLGQGWLPDPRLTLDKMATIRPNPSPQAPLNSGRRCSRRGNTPRRSSRRPRRSTNGCARPSAG